MSLYVVIVKALLPDSQLYCEDRFVAGRYGTLQESEEEVLDWFHSSVAIKVLDDFEITVEKL